MQMNPNKDTRLCISMSGRPGNFGLRFHNHLYEQFGLNFYYKAFSPKDLEGHRHPATANTKSPDAGMAPTRSLGLKAL